jgi:hypothetical protein
MPGGKHRPARPSPDAFERKVVLAAGDKPLATLWLGESPNFRRVYGRADGDDAIYDLDLRFLSVGMRKAKHSVPTEG